LFKPAANIPGPGADYDYLLSEEHREVVRALRRLQPIRPGEIQSLYFDPTTFQLTESRDGSNSEPSTYDGPSPAYNAPTPSPAKDPANLTGPGFLDVMQSESVLDSPPSLPSGCTSY